MPPAPPVTTTVLPRKRATSGAPRAVVRAPERLVLARVPEDVLQFLRAHPAHRPGRHAHDERAGGDDLAGGHEGAGAHLGAHLDHGAARAAGADAHAEEGPGGGPAAP